MEELRVRVSARAGLLGNPSDGYFGKTISFEVKNFYAEVVMIPSDRLQVLPHPIADPDSFDSLEHLHAVISKDGYYGGRRLILACCKVFFDYCKKQGIELRRKGNFKISYDTTVPRQVGLAGSSAIVTATWQALMQYHGLTASDIPKEVQPSLILSVEKNELGINAGLQDRVIQTYGGCVFMDFNRHVVESTGHGKYEPIDPRLLPQFYLAYIGNPTDSGVKHSTVRKRWDEGDSEVHEAMKTFASFAEEGRKALLAKDFDRLGELMNANFDLRRKIFTDASLGSDNIRMVEIGRKLGASTKFSGSGGCVLGLIPKPDIIECLKSAYEAEGYTFVLVDTGFSPANF